MEVLALDKPVSLNFCVVLNLVPGPKFRCNSRHLQQIELNLLNAFTLRCVHRCYFLKLMRFSCYCPQCCTRSYQRAQSSCLGARASQPARLSAETNTSTAPVYPLLIFVFSFYYIWTELYSKSNRLQHWQGDKTFCKYTTAKWVCAELTCVTLRPRPSLGSLLFSKPQGTAFGILVPKRDDTKKDCFTTYPSFKVISTDLGRRDFFPPFYFKGSAG